ncbi:MAG: hypothetical protein FJ095_17460 [Deltaproteobacteria bacterium]|nr:hypothetical protein [Deltaproteobacteria bacterium]
MNALRRWLAARLARASEEPRLAPAARVDVAEAQREQGELREALEAARRQAAAAREAHEREQGESRAAREAAARELAHAKQTLAEAQQTLEVTARELVEARGELLARERELAAARSVEATPRAVRSEGVQGRSSNEDDEDEDARRPARTGGRRVAELEARVRDLEAHAARLLGRAEDAERELARRSERDRDADEARPRRREVTSPLPREDSRRPDAHADTEPSRSVDNASRGALAEVWWSPGQDCLEAIHRRIDEADRCIDVCVFTITDDRLAQALLAAHRRGLAIRVITDNDKAEDEGSDVHRLERAGLEVRVDRTEYHMHHKFAVFDRRYAITGSYNWTRGAARNNEEHIVVTDEPRIVAALASGFERLWRSLGPATRGGRRGS